MRLSVRERGRSVPESSTGDGAFVQCAPVEYQADIHFHAAECVHMELTDALYSNSRN